MRFIILFFMACYSQITNINLETNPIWMATQEGSLNYTYMITGSNQQYLSVLITLSEPNSDFILVSNSSQAVRDLNQQFTQGTTIDIISAQENRLTRNLNFDITENILPIYISTFDKTSKSKHEIIIKSSDKMGCPNDCSGQGECLQQGCKCFKNYVGNDCHQTANEINGTDEYQLFLKDSATFFYLLLDEYLGQNVEIEFSTLDDCQIKIQLLKSQSPAYQPYTESQFNENLFEQNTLTNKNSKIIQFKGIDYININNRVVFVVLVQNKNATLNVLISKTSNDETSLKDYQIALIIILPLLFFCGLVFLCYKKCKNRNHQRPNPNPTPLPVPHIIEIQNNNQQPQNLNQIQVEENNQNLAENSIYNIHDNLNTNDNNNQNINFDNWGNSNDNNNPQFNSKNTHSNVQNSNNNGDNNNNANHNSNDNHYNNQGNQLDNDICLICKQNLVDGKETSSTICKHIFHQDCLITWAQDHNSCPKCEADLPLQIPQAQISQVELKVN